MAPRDEAMLVHMLRTAVTHDGGPVALRYPRGEAVGVALPADPAPIEIGTGEVLREGERVAIVGYGSGVQKGLEAADLLAERGIEATVADAACQADRHWADGPARGRARPARDGRGGRAVRRLRHRRVGDALPTPARPPHPARGPAGPLRDARQAGLLHEEVGYTGEKIAERIEAAVMDPRSALAGA